LENQKLLELIKKLLLLVQLLKSKELKKELELKLMDLKTKNLKKKRNLINNKKIKKLLTKRKPKKLWLLKKLKLLILKNNLLISQKLDVAKPLKKDVFSVLLMKVKPRKSVEFAHSQP
jgi:hypothetical protein